jgi:hypothetical protein
MGGATLARVFVWGEKSEYRFTCVGSSFVGRILFSVERKILSHRMDFL